MTLGLNALMAKQLMRLEAVDQLRSSQIPKLELPSAPGDQDLVQVGRWMSDTSDILKVLKEAEGAKSNQIS